METPGFQKLRPLSIIFFLIQVLAAVHLNDQFSTRRTEVELYMAQWHAACGNEYLLPVKHVNMPIVLFLLDQVLCVIPPHALIILGVDRFNGITTEL